MLVYLVRIILIHLGVNFIKLFFLIKSNLNLIQVRKFKVILEVQFDIIFLAVW